MCAIEKVIKGLECCLPMTERNGIGDCGECPYDRKITLEGGITECCHELMLEAHALLKAQEPRVMTLEEYDAWTDLPFTERDPVFHEERTERGTVTCWVNTTVCSLREYGKNDRCWTSRPTDEQREAEPWSTAESS